MVPWLIPPAKRGLPLLMSCKQRYESDGPRFSMYIRENECSSNTVTIIFIDFIPSNQFDPPDYANFKGMFGLFITFHLVTKLKIIIIFLLRSFFLGRLSPIPGRPSEIAHQFCSCQRHSSTSPFLLYSSSPSLSIYFS